MSTFDGFLHEFPQIRIDYFRTLSGRPPPLACFLSHVHSDHLLGLESFRSPFVYCSPATRQILLRLEKYPHRMNFAKGVLECRKQTYTHLRKLLKPLPLETPTKIELSPGNEIQVTLFDANHCVGAVMFLLEGNGKAALYTGDIRAELHTINHLCRHPTMLPYVPTQSGGAGLLRLDTVYLDTTFAVKSSPYRRFPPKAAGLAELLHKLQAYPADTLFYFHSWTYGYEDVWLALSHTLESRIHLDHYRYRLYSSLAHDQGPSVDCPEAASLCEFKVGNVYQLGILTDDPHVRLHSCEKATGCPVLNDSRPDIVHIKPIIARHKGTDIGELGIGGRSSDMDQIHELDLEDPTAVARLIALCASQIQNEDDRKTVIKILQDYLAQNRTTFDLPTDAATDFGQVGAAPLTHTVDIIRRIALESSNGPNRQLPRTITFPYSRHSSYEELRNLVAALRPRDVWPCTAPPAKEYIYEKSMENLFGDLCSSIDGETSVFKWDRLMEDRLAEMRTGEQGGVLDVGERDESFNIASEPGDGITDAGKRHLSWSSREERLRIREEAFEAALEGRWDQTKLKSTSKTYGRAHSEEL